MRFHRGGTDDKNLRYAGFARKKFRKADALNGFPEPHLVCQHGATRRSSEGATEIIVLAAPGKRPTEGRVAWLPPERLPGCPPFAVHYGDGPPYALVCAEQPGPDGLRLFHTSDREAVEALAFRLQRELLMPSLT